jgi:hypothetical protein
MSNVERILGRLDGHLVQPTSLVLYGRAAVCLGFNDPPAAALLTQDVDCIIPISRLDDFGEDSGFWDAQEATNRELLAEGLYITHLFRSDQVFLRRDWEAHLVPVTPDLILTKMMRGDDPQDMDDIAFMLRHDRIKPARLEAAFRDVVLPDLVELRDAFRRAQPRVREIMRAAGF